MSSTIFYKFFHQKVQSTIHFDGTGISVFDLKHEIIVQNNLGEGTDFNLRLYHLDQPDLEYDNDQEVVPRSTYLLARRLPSALRNAKFGNALRYVSGKPRIQRRPQPMLQPAAAAAGAPDARIDENMSEADRIKMMFENQSTAWAQTQDELLTHRVVYSKPGAASTAAEDQPPPGYMCYRCGGKDHWIRNCPTNTDPNYEGKKIKRTTGIPRLYLKTILKEAAEHSLQNPNSQITTNENGDLVDAQGNTYMVTDTGEYVIAMADSKTWNSYQQKQSNAARQHRVEYERKLVEAIERDGEVDFLNPLANTPGVTTRLLHAPIVMTPCCQLRDKLQKMANYNYNQLELELALIDTDFRCPNCNTEDVYLDALVRNEALEKRLAEYVAAKEKELGLEGDGGDAKRQKTAPARPTGPANLPLGPLAMAPMYAHQ
jgi:protein MPE1